MMPDVDTLCTWTLTVCWGSFVLVWLAAWIYNLLRAPKCVERHFSPTILIGVALAYVVPLLVPGPVWDAITFDQPPLQVAGLILLAGGTAFAMYARFALGTMWTNIPSLRNRHELRTTGPYALTRHPIYTGVICMLVGTMLAFGVGSYAAAAIAGVIGLVQNMRIEERLLVRAFGTRYEAYRRAVPALIPIPRQRPQRVQYRQG